FPDNLFKLRRKVFLQQAYPARYLIRGKEEGTPGSVPGDYEPRARQANTVLCEVKTLMEFLPPSGFQIVPIHLRQSSQDSSPSRGHSLILCFNVPDSVMSKGVAYTSLVLYRV